MSDELIRLVRTMVQAASTAVVGYLAARGVDLEVEPLVAVLLPLAMVVVTATVQIVSDRVPFLGPIVGLLNGPRREVRYEVTPTSSTPD